MSKYDCLKLENQLCFPLYACSKAITKHYKPFLDELDLTYTQYITMMVLWEKKSANVSDLGKCLYLDSGTLTPVIKKLEAKGYLKRSRSKEDERNLIVTVTELMARITWKMACLSFETTLRKYVSNLVKTRVNVRSSLMMVTTKCSHLQKEKNSHRIALSRR
jgi:DNA-binding MarR family transcriptional regulator